MFSFTLSFLLSVLSWSGPISTIWKPVDLLSFLLTVVSRSVTRLMTMFGLFVSWASSRSPYRVRGQIC